MGDWLGGHSRHCVLLLLLSGSGLGLSLESLLPGFLDLLGSFLLLLGGVLLGTGLVLNDSLEVGFESGKIALARLFSSEEGSVIL